MGTATDDRIWIDGRQTDAAWQDRTGPAFFFAKTALSWFSTKTIRFDLSGWSHSVQ